MKVNTLLSLGAGIILCLALHLAAFAQTIPNWAPNTAYAAGALVMYQGVEYKCIQAHTSEVGWEPPNVPALWQPVSGSPTPTPTPTPAPTPTPSPTPSGGGGGSCAAPWSATEIYTGGMMASVGNNNYTAAFWTQNQNPTTPGNSGPAGSGDPWSLPVSCAAGGPTPSPTPTPKPTPTPTPLPPGSKLFAPYNDMSLTVSEGLVANVQTAGLKAVTLAFLVANGSCSYGWGGLGGTLPTDNEPNGTTVQSIVQQLQADGITVIISFGGANGSIVNGCSSASSLEAGLQTVINRYGVTMLDFDMEASDTLGDGAGLPVLDQALKGLKSANPSLVVSFTLPVLPTGLINTGIAVLNQAHTDGFTPDVINVMAMDYGSANDNSGQMGLDATDAASAVHSQIQQAGLSSNVGVTVMIGINDTNTEIFQLTDVNTLVNFANSNTYITRLSFWSFARDNGGCPNQGFASPTCSGISQNNFQFSQSFEPF
jgi:Carbohydrate-binding module family 5/12/Glycosyl hydrolases family 18